MADEDLCKRPRTKMTELYGESPLPMLPDRELKDLAVRVQRCPDKAMIEVALDFRSTLGHHYVSFFIPDKAATLHQLSTEAIGYVAGGAAEAVLHAFTEKSGK